MVGQSWAPVQPTHVSFIPDGPRRRYNTPEGPPHSRTRGASHDMWRRQARSARFQGQSRRDRSDGPSPEQATRVGSLETAHAVRNSTLHCAVFAGSLGPPAECQPHEHASPVHPRGGGGRRVRRRGDGYSYPVHRPNGSPKAWAAAMGRSAHTCDTPIHLSPPPLGPHPSHRHSSKPRSSHYLIQTLARIRDIVGMKAATAVMPQEERNRVPCTIDMQGANAARTRQQGSRAQGSPSPHKKIL
jgi:hypothetical protein